MKAKLFLFLSLVVLIFGGCKKDNDDSSTGGTSGLKVKTSLSGRIFDESGNAVSGATVMAGNVTAITDQYGIFFIKNVELEENRSLVRINKTGYWEQIGSCIPSAGTVTYHNFTLFNASSTQVVNGVAGGTVTHSSGGSVTFPANAFVTATGTAYTGNVNVCMHRIAADDSTLGLKVPGSDLLAINAANEDGILITYGMIGVKLTDGSGNTIKIADGKKASIKFPIAVGQLSSAPATIDLWYFDESKGKWKEEGTATKVGNNYEGDVAHFSWWNCDVFFDIAEVEGYIIDCNGNPASGWALLAYANSSGFGGGYTDGNGYYHSIIPANEDVDLFGYFYNVYANQITNSTQTISFIYPVGNTVNTLPILQEVNSSCSANTEGIIVDCSNNPVSASVIFLDSLYNYLGYTISNNNGYFSKLINSSFVRVVVNNGSTYGNTASSLNLTIINNLGTIPLCDSVATNNNFQLTFVSQGTGTFNASYQVSSCKVSGTNPNMFIKFFDYSSTTGAISNIDLAIPNYSVGTYAWNGANSNLTGIITLNGQQYTVSGVTPSSGSTTITGSGSVGSQITGSFNGLVELSANGSVPLVGNLSASFNIYRNY